MEWHRNGHPTNPELGLCATTLRETGEFVGRCGLLPWTLDGRDEVEVAYMIAPGHWGKGLATEAAQGIVRHAVRGLRLTRLICLIDYGNIASKRVAEKIGMSFERTGTDDMVPYELYSVNGLGGATGT